MQQMTGRQRADRPSTGVPLADMVQALRSVVDRVQGPAYGVPTVELMGEVRVLQDLLAVGAAVQMVRIAQFAAREEDVDEDGVTVTADRGVGHVSDFAGDELGPVLGAAPVTAQRRAQVAAKLAADLPVTLRALAQGDLDAYRAQVVAEELALADRDVCTVVESMVYPDGCADTAGRLRSRLQRALREVDPLAVRAAAAKARAQRFVRVQAGALPGVSEWWASMPTEDSVACWAAIEDVAHRMKAEDHTRSLDACRLDALVDLILGRVEVQTTVTLAVPVHTAASAARAARPAGPTTAPEGDDGQAPPDDGDSAPWSAQAATRGEAFFSATGEPAAEAEVDQGCPDAGYEIFGIPGGLSFATGCEIRGMGYIPGDVIADLLARFDTRISRMLIDSATGVTIETTSNAYRPPEAIRRNVRARDGTCRFPGCGVQARRCDLDHVESWPRGPTTAANLICLCRHHHRLKTHMRWRAVLAPDGTVTWTDPYGGQWLTRPLDHLATHVA